jgi:Hemerythrin HHE cation binding domain
VSETVPRTTDIETGLMLVVHRAFQRDLGRMIQTLTDPRRPGRRQRRLLAARWEHFYESLRIHHLAEDMHIWPLLRVRIANQRMLDDMVSEHAVLDPLLESVRPAFEAYVRKGPAAHVPAATQADLTRQLEGILDVLSRHLSHEEEDALPLMGSHLSPGEWDAFVEPQRRGNSRSGGRWFMLWLLDGAPPPARAAVLGRQPRWRRVLITRFWEPKYRRTTQATFAQR